jgi:tetratricopeptide (TPR) repeat protein
MLPDQVLRYAADWHDDTGPSCDEEALAAAYLGLLRPKVEAVIAARTAARETASRQGRDAAAVANAAFEEERAAHVEGRDAELARLGAYLVGETGAGLPLMVTGAPGCGKSTLLAAATVRAAAAYPNAARIVRYCGVTPGAERLIALLSDVRLAVARAYGLTEPPTLTDENELISAVATQLATVPASPERPLLLMIDALDQLGVRTQRTDWLPPRLAPHVRVVVSVLADRPELGYLRARLPAEQVLTLTPLGRAAGQAMLHDLLAATPSRTLTPAQEEAVLSAFTGQGVPLHLRLLAAEARGWHSFDLPYLGGAPLPVSTPELLTILLERLEGPEHAGRALVARALGDLAVARIGLGEDELLDLLARDAAVRDEYKVLSPYSPPIDSGLPLPAVLWARLHAQVAPLLTERQADAGARLMTFYHGQLRAAVEARYLDGTERPARHQALADYFGGQPWRLGPDQWNWRKVREVVSQWEGAGDRVAAEQALGSLADTMASPDAQAQDAAGTVAVMTSFRDHLETGGYWQVGLRLYAQELAAVRKMGNRAVEGETLANMGLLSFHLGHPEESAREYGEAIVLLREAGNRAGEGSTLNNLGTLAFGQGRSEEAISYLQRALTIRREVDDRAGEGSTLNNLGQVVDLMGQRDAAAGYYAQALAIQREVGDRAGEAVTLNNLGQLAYQLGRAEETANYFQQALVVLREVGDRPGEAQALSNLGSLEGRLGQWDKAQAHFEEALAIQREVIDRSAEGTTLTNLGALAAHTGRREDAARTFEQALAILRDVGDRQGEGNTLNSLGALARDQGQFEAAAQYYAQALPIVREVGDRAMEGVLLNNLGSLTRAQGRPAEAKVYLEQALSIERAVGDRSGEGHTLNNLGALVREQSQFEEASRYFDQALAIRREVGDREGEAGTLTNLGALARVMGRPEEAARDYAQALAICEAIGAVDLANTVRGNIVYLNEQQAAARPERRRHRWWPFGRSG